MSWGKREDRERKGLWKRVSGERGERKRPGKREGERERIGKMKAFFGEFE